MKIVLVTGDQPNQKALANKVAAEFDLVGIVLEKNVPPIKKVTVKKVLKKINDLIFFRKISTAWNNLMGFYEEKYPSYPQVNIFRSSSANSPEVFDFIKSLHPDLIMISGTSLIKKPFFELNPPKGIINLHTGLSPYVKGGPNCTNWCLANDEFHLIGNTIMWLSLGIDSGNIITTDFVDFDGTETLNEIHIKVMEHGHELYLKTLRLIDKHPEKVPSVKQNEIAKGSLYLNKTWTDEQKAKLLKNIQKDRFRTIVQSKEFKNKRKEITTIPLSEF